MLFRLCVYIFFVTTQNDINGNKPDFVGCVGISGVIC